MRRAVVVGRPRAARKRCGRLCAFQRKFRVFQRAFRAARQGHRRAARARGGYRRAEECVDFTHNLLSVTRNVGFIRLVLRVSSFLRTPC